MTASTATVVGVLDRLHRAGIRFDTRHGRLVVDVPDGSVDDDLLAELADHRSQ